MKVLLINPWSKTGSFRRDIKLPPLGLAYIAGSLLTSDQTVHILDLSVSEDPLSDLIRELRTFSPDLAGITVTSPQMPVAIEIAERIHEFDRRIEVMFGGVHPTLFPEVVLSHPCVHYVIRGEGERTVREFVLARDAGKSLKSILGLAYKENGTITVNPARPLIRDLDQLAWPAVDLLPIRLYRSVQIADTPFLTMITSRGCPHECIYCDARTVSGQRYRVHSPGRVIAEMKHIVGTHHIKEIMFKDSDFTLWPSRVESLCEAIIHEKIPIQWSCNGRVGDLSRAVLVKMRKAGCRMIQFGVESGDPVMLTRLNKRITLDDSVKTFEDCRSSGIQTVANIMIGIPGENLESLEKTGEFIRRIRPDSLNISFLTPYPGTPLYRMALENQWLIKGYDPHRIPMDECVMNATELTIPELKAQFRRMVRSFYFRPEFLLRRIRSSHAVEWRNNFSQFINLLKQ
jgi:anaerobic magnesium-protoporphyrin IX monomethyl ester cyclase